MQNMQDENNNNNEDNVEDDDRSTTSTSSHRSENRSESNNNNNHGNRREGWSGYQQNALVNKQTNDFINKWKDFIILDTGSTITSFMNPDLVTKIQATKNQWE